MIGFSILSDLFTNIIQTKFVTGVFHSVMMKPVEGGGMKPATPIGKRWKYVGPDDTTGFSCYCRQNGSADVDSIEKIGGCNTKIYTLKVPQRLVFYNANEKRSHDEIIASMLKAVIKTNLVKFQKLVNIPEEVLRSEAPTGRFKFTDQTLYFAIEFFVLLDVQADTCETEIKCEGIPNPFCLPNGTQQV